MQWDVIKNWYPSTRPATECSTEGLLQTQLKGEREKSRRAGKAPNPDATVPPATHPPARIPHGMISPSARIKPA